MPGKDQTGPSGSGPMTGRATGRCNKNATDERGGRGRGAGRGMGRGRQQGFDPQTRMAELENRRAALEGNTD